jgi:Flp pilus assembly pilin Flp
MKNTLIKASMKTSNGLSDLSNFVIKRSKGAGFFEYSLLALVAVGLMAIVYTLFADRINDLFTDSVNPALPVVPKAP